MTYATATDVTNRWGQSVTDTAILTLITTRLADVERLILKRIPDLADQITAGTIDQADVVQVESDAVLRLARNPEGYMSETDGSYTYQLSSQLASGNLEILPSEWAILGLRQGFFSMEPKICLPHFPREVGWGLW